MIIFVIGRTAVDLMCVQIPNGGNLLYYIQMMKMMKKIYLFAAAALACIVASCDKDSDGSENPQQPEAPAGLVIPQPYFEGYYYGDYYGVGTGNIGFALVDLENDEVAYFELIFEAAPDINPDKVTLPEGTYPINDSYDPGTCDIDGCYFMSDTEDFGSMVYFKEGTVTVTAVSGGSKVVVDAVLTDGTAVKMEYSGPVKTNNNTASGHYSNLEKNVSVTGLTQASMAKVGDMVGDEVTESWILSLGDRHYDLKTDWGVGYSIILYMNLEYGLEAVPAGRYDVFVDARTVYELQPDTLMTGCKVEGNLYGCWYMCPAVTDVAALVGGSVDIAVDGDVYTITGTLKDGYDNKVSFSYKGEVKLMEISYDENGYRRPERLGKVR